MYLVISFGIHVKYSNFAINAVMYFICSTNQIVMLVYAIQKNFVSRMHLPPFDWLDYLLDTKFIRVRPIEIFGTHYIFPSLFFVNATSLQKIIQYPICRHLHRKIVYVFDK